MESIEPAEAAETPVAAQSRAPRLSAEETRAAVLHRPAPEQVSVPSLTEAEVRAAEEVAQRRRDLEEAERAAELASTRRAEFEERQARATQDVSVAVALFESAAEVAMDRSMATPRDFLSLGAHLKQLRTDLQEAVGAATADAPDPRLASHPARAVMNQHPAMQFLSAILLPAMQRRDMAVGE